MRAVCFVSLLVICSSSADLLDFLEPKLPENPALVEVLQTEGDVSAKPVAVVFVTNQLSDPQADALSRLTSGRSAPVSVCVAREGVLKDATEGQIVVFHGGRRSVYHGLHDAITILKHLSAIGEASIKTIANKIDKVAFDRTKRTKLVGYFAIDSSELAAFEQSAVLFGTQIAFFVVTDPVVAKHVKLNATGQIYLVREFDKTPISCPKNPATLADIQQLIVHNRESFIKVTPTNVKDPSFNKIPSILLITDSSPLSFHLVKLVARIQRDSPEIRPRVLWIEANDFPTMDVAARPIHGLAKLPGLGFWDPASGSSQWMNLQTLYSAPSDRIQEDQNLLLIKAFMSLMLPTSTPPPNPLPDTSKAEL